MSTPQSPSEQRPTTAFVLGLLSGVGMVTIGGLPLFLLIGWWFTLGRLGADVKLDSIISTIWWPWLSTISGLVLMIGSNKFHTHPDQHKGWGITILVISAVGLLLGFWQVSNILPSPSNSLIVLGLTAFLLACVLGTIGGALALNWKPLSKNL